jgi:hypothetical protein
MKTLIRKSIEIWGMGHPENKTVFNLNEIETIETHSPVQSEEIKKKEIENQNILNDIRFKSLVSISGRKLSIHFSYVENETKCYDRIQLTIPRDKTESQIEDFIISSINIKLLN